MGRRGNEKIEGANIVSLMASCPHKFSSVFRQGVLGATPPAQLLKPIKPYYSYSDIVWRGDNFLTPTWRIPLHFVLPLDSNLLMSVLLSRFSNILEYTAIFYANVMCIASAQSLNKNDWKWTLQSKFLIVWFKYSLKKPGTENHHGLRLCFVVSFQILILFFSSCLWPRWCFYREARYSLLSLVHYELIVEEEHTSRFGFHSDLFGVLFFFWLCPLLQYYDYLLLLTMH